ncbi:MAG: sigma-70 family RNA polymerase sigma factor [Bacteroidia bacterium]|nr:sigma-70 family RNA polymerase sigma factor [Bacteroidia bacterium]MDW8235739.1 sigma-70 family RNA polymerase sigma factor [Bacteroidia bacterium]MDW8417617.1 sigma-70 family RNA polymerase sigma factor [Bacteroidia bacterium]
MSPESNDVELVVLYQQGGEAAEEAYNLLVSRYYAVLLRSCRYFLYHRRNQRLAYEGINELARDITHDFLMDQMPRVIQRYEKSKGSFATWLNRCLFNFVTDVLRQRPQGIIDSFQPEEEEWKSHPILEELSIENPVIQYRDVEDIRQIIQRLLDTLPDHYRTPLIMRFWQEMSIEKIAVALRLPIGTVKSQISRGIEILRQRLRAVDLEKELR